LFKANLWPVNEEPLLCTIFLLVVVWQQLMVINRYTLFQSINIQSENDLNDGLNPCLPYYRKISDQNSLAVKN
jgi:hypothetical protein